MENNNSNMALLFVPDISGFTNFVRNTEIEHSQHIIKGLLEKLIDANEIGLQVSEVEGDAILFYRFGNPPDAVEFFKQVEKMFVSFHSLLKLIEIQSICQCGACSSANNLTLKIVAHYGTITQTQIKDHTKLFGQDVITVHRLLKNDISHHEYVLFTKTLTDKWKPPTLPQWANREESSQQYDVGIINYNYAQLSPLKQFVPEPAVEEFSIPGIKYPVFYIEENINCSIEQVFSVLTDLPNRMKWMHGAQKIELLNDEPNHIGTHHRCVVDKNSPVMVTSGFKKESEVITFTETDKDKKMCSVYTLRKLSSDKTTLRVDGFIKDNLILKVMFNLFLKKKVRYVFQASMKNLKRYCEELYNNQQVSVEKN